jgi:hypothetical protein
MKKILIANCLALMLQAQATNGPVNAVKYGAMVTSTPVASDRQLTTPEFLRQRVLWPQRMGQPGTNVVEFVKADWSLALRKG